MKFYKKLLQGGVSILAMALSLAFVACSNDDAEDDENLVVSITSNQNLVTIVAPDEYAGKSVKIIYMTDGTDPLVKLNDDKTDVVITGTEYTAPFAIAADATVTVKARGYYAEGTTFYQGPIATKSITYEELTAVTTSAETNTATGASSGTFTFTLAETGNSNITHYFDTYRSNVFKLNDDHPTVYYQTQFSWKGTSKGNWYLYMRDLNGGLVKASNGSNFLANGTYTGACFNNTKGNVAAGDLTLYNGTNTTDGKKATVEAVTSDDTTTYQFALKVNNSGAVSSSSSGNSSGTQYDTLGTFTVDAK